MKTYLWRKSGIVGSVPVYQTNSGIPVIFQSITMNLCTWESGWSELPQIPPVQLFTAVSDESCNVGSFCWITWDLHGHNDSAMNIQKHPPHFLYLPMLRSHDFEILNANQRLLCCVLLIMCFAQLSRKLDNCHSIIHLQKHLVLLKTTTRK